MVHMLHMLAATFMIASISLATLWTIYTNVVTISSHAHSLLPPWDAEPFAPFPTFQKYYRVFIYILGYVGASYRSTVYPSLSTKDGAQQSPASVKSQNGNGGSTV